MKKLNRCSKEVQTEEREWWNHLLISDMSEESDDEGTLVVHKPSYRSLGMYICAKVLSHQVSTFLHTTGTGCLALPFLQDILYPFYTCNDEITATLQTQAQLCIRALLTHGI